MTVVVTAPNEAYTLESKNNMSVFLAGGITGCPDWQSEVLAEMQGYPLTIYNPRRENFPIGDPSAAEQQIVWEYKHLKDADVVAFWFSRGSLNPIVLYELGMWGTSRSKRVIVVGVDPEYERKLDVVVQCQLAMPSLKVCTSLKQFIAHIQCIGNIVEEGG